MHQQYITLLVSLFFIANNSYPTLLATTLLPQINNNNSVYISLPSDTEKKTKNHKPQLKNEKNRMKRKMKDWNTVSEHYKPHIKDLENKLQPSSDDSDTETEDTYTDTDEEIAMKSELRRLKRENENKQAVQIQHLQANMQRILFATNNQSTPYIRENDKKESASLQKLDEKLSSLLAQQNFLHKIITSTMLLPTTIFLFKTTPTPFKQKEKAHKPKHCYLNKKAHNSRK